MATASRAVVRDHRRRQLRTGTCARDPRRARHARCAESRSTRGTTLRPCHEAAYRALALDAAIRSLRRRRPRASASRPERALGLTQICVSLCPTRVRARLADRVWTKRARRRGNTLTLRGGSSWRHTDWSGVPHASARPVAERRDGDRRGRAASAVCSRASLVRGHQHSECTRRAPRSSPPTCGVIGHARQAIRLKRERDLGGMSPGVEATPAPPTRSRLRDRLRYGLPSARHVSARSARRGSGRTYGHARAQGGGTDPDLGAKARRPALLRRAALERCSSMRDGCE